MHLEFHEISLFYIGWFKFQFIVVLFGTTTEVAIFSRLQIHTFHFLCNFHASVEMKMFLKRQNKPFRNNTVAIFVAKDVFVMASEFFWANGLPPWQHFKVVMRRKCLEISHIWLSSTSTGLCQFFLGEHYGVDYQIKVCSIKIFYLQPAKQMPAMMCKLHC